ncbi:MAG: CAP domain-containing protein [Candidatus Micrarchaeia archaeon]
MSSNSKKHRLFIDILFVILILFLLFIFIIKTDIFSNIKNNIVNISIQNTSSNYILNSSLNNLVIPANKVNITQLDNYTLGLINKDREKYGLNPVSISNIPSAQQHAESMLNYSYFSHWDLFGLKPYMRYTLLGGNQSVQENIAYEKSSVCEGSVCKGDINVTKAIENMEYQMMYNDSKCCNNGHRDNILNPFHNMVSIGIAYDASTVYFVEDFVNQYINWSQGSPSYSNTGEVYLYGISSVGTAVKQVYITYDPIPSNYTKSTVPDTPYSFGNEIAGVVPQSNYYFTNITTIVADHFYTKNNIFQINFNIKNLTKRYGAGVYTIMLELENTTTNKTFLGTDYSIFINKNLSQYIPENV